MSATIEIFWGEPPREKSETDFLNQLVADLKNSGKSATILANYFTASSSRQIDFLVITERHVCHVELKHYPAFLVGSMNGPWSIRRPDGTMEEIDRQNPYTQAYDCKMAISDDMHVAAEQNSTVPWSAARGKFYRQIDSVVCVFPRLDAQSQVPNDYKVRTLGYAEFVRFLTRPGKNPGWAAEHWSALIRMLGLTNATEPTQRTLPKNIAQVRANDYVGWFKDFYSRKLHEFVPLPLIAGEARLSFSEVVTTLQQKRHIQLIGPPGSGKSHLARHALIDLSDRSVVPILIEGTMYQGRLYPLLDRSVGPFMTGGAKDLLLAAAINGQDILAVIDGFNECPTSLQERLLRDLSSFCRRAKALTLITSQEAVDVPGLLSGAVVHIDDLTEADRQAVLRSYGASGISHLCEPFTTAYELSVAAECAGELRDYITRAGLFSAFIRKRLKLASSPASIHNALRQLALAMDEKLRTSLPVDEATRIVERYLASISAPPGVLDEAIQSSLTTTRQGTLSFTHELIGRFLVAEALLLRSPQLPDLVQELRRPRHEDLSQFAVELESDSSQAGELLDGLADWHLCAQALRGNFGPIATRAAQAAARRLLGAVIQGMPGVTFTVHPEYELTVDGGYQLSTADRALLAAIGALLHEDVFLHEVAQLFDATDTACRRSADHQAKAERRRPTASALVATVLVGLGRTARSTVAVSIILEALANAHADSLFRAYRGRPGIGIDELYALADQATPTSYGRLMLLCALLQRLKGLEAATLALRTARLCWDTGAYHVQLEGLSTIQSFVAETRDQPLGDEIINFLERLEVSHNIGLSTQLVELLFAYGRIEASYEGDDIRTEIDEILGSPVNEQSAQLAHTIVSNQFEDVISEPFYTAIESLTASDKVKLYAIAALAAPAYGLTTDWLLTELAKSGDRTALPALEHWATHLDTGGFYRQGSTACYLLALQGCARFLDEPPRLADCQTDDQEAWQSYGSIVFWMYHPQTDEGEELTAQCAPYWQQLTGKLLSAAADPLYHFLWAGRSYDQEGKPVLLNIITRFPGEARRIMVWSLQHGDSLSSLFPWPEREDRARQIINMLSIVGDTETIELLRSFTEDHILGRDAIEAIRKLSNQLS